MKKWGREEIEFLKNNYSNLSLIYLIHNIDSPKFKYTGGFYLE